MGLETELKFLIKGKSWKQDLQGVSIKQSYICRHPKRSVRVRTYGEDAFLTIKGERKNDANMEFEWQIDPEQAQQMMAQDELFVGFTIAKNRYVLEETAFTWKGQHLKWELDEFLDENKPLQVAEIELKNIEDEREKEQLTKLIMDHRPAWIGDYIDMAEDPALTRYMNSNLSKKPFSQWSPEEQAPMLRHL